MPISSWSIVVFVVCPLLQQADLCFAAVLSWCCAQVSGERDFFAQMVVAAVTALDPSTLDLKMVGMKKVSKPSWLRHGVTGS